MNEKEGVEKEQPHENFFFSLTHVLHISYFSVMARQGVNSWSREPQDTIPMHAMRHGASTHIVLQVSIPWAVDIGG